jgi:hypothetical protein
VLLDGAGRVIAYMDRAVVEPSEGWQRWWRATSPELGSELEGE